MLRLPIITTYQCFSETTAGPIWPDDHQWPPAGLAPLTTSLLLPLKGRQTETHREKSELCAAERDDAKWPRACSRQPARRTTILIVVKVPPSHWLRQLAHQIPPIDEHTS
jgi:hypothetical protein